MAEKNENAIGLAELIEQVKQELLNPPPGAETDPPVFAVDSVELELQVTVKKDARAGIKIYVIDVGGGGSRDDIQKVKVKLSPLLDKKQLLAIYKDRYPDRWKAFVRESGEALTKGVEGNLSDQF